MFKGFDSSHVGPEKSELAVQALESENFPVFSTNSTKLLITSTTIAACTSRLEHMLSISSTIIDVNMSGLPFKMGLV